MTVKKTGPMRVGAFRLDMPEPTPGEDQNVTWLRDMVKQRRAEGVPHHGEIMVGEERVFRGMLRGSIVEELEHQRSAILDRAAIPAYPTYSRRNYHD